MSGSRPLRTPPRGRGGRWRGSGVRHERRSGTRPAAGRALVARRDPPRPARLEGALADLDALLAANPSHGQAQLDRATLLEAQGDFLESERACSNVARLSPRLVSEAIRLGERALGKIDLPVSRASAPS